MNTQSYDTFDTPLCAECYTSNGERWSGTSMFDTWYFYNRRVDNV